MVTKSRESLIEVKIIPAKEVSELHWKSVKIDTHRSPYTGGKRLKKNVKYHRIGADRKICIEEGCTKLVEDARRLTCSVKCRNLRANRQRKVHVEKENNSKDYLQSRIDRYEKMGFFQE